MSTTAPSYIPKIARSGRGIAMKSNPTPPATIRPIRDATHVDRALRSGNPAPRSCPAPPRLPPISPTEVHVISEKSSVYPTA